MLDHHGSVDEEWRMRLQERLHAQDRLAPVRLARPVVPVGLVESVLERAADEGHHRLDVTHVIGMVERPPQRNCRSIGAVDPDHDEASR